MPTLLPPTHRSSRRRTPSRRVTALLSAALAALTLAACAGGESSSATGEGLSVKVATLRQPHLFAPAFYKQFLPAGSTVEVIELANSTDVKNAVISGSAAFGVVGITAALAGAAQGEPVRVIASAADGGSALVGRPGVSTVAELKGKKIGYVAGSSQDILLRLELRAAGLTVDDVTLVKIGFADMPAALKRGDIDAFSSAEVGTSIALADGATLIKYPYDTKIAKINIALITSQGEIDRNPARVGQVLAAHAKATDFMAANKPEWGKRVSAAYNFAAEPLATALDNITPRWQIDDAYIEQTKVLGQQMLELKQITKLPDFSTFFNRSFLKAAEAPVAGS